MRLSFGIILVLLLAATVALAVDLHDQDRQAYSGSPCAAAPDEFFENEVWSEVGARSCLECHNAGGDAAESDFVLLDPKRSLGAPAQEDIVRHNREQFAQMARMTVNDQS